MESPPNILPSLSDINNVPAAAAVVPAVATATRYPTPPPSTPTPIGAAPPTILYSTNGRSLGSVLTNQATAATTTTANPSSSNGTSSFSSSMRNTPPFNSSSTISITNGIYSQSSSLPINPPPSLENMINKIDNFFRAAAIAAYRKNRAAIAVISCRFSIKILQNNVKDFIYFPNDVQPTHILAPFFFNQRAVMAVFNILDKRVAYFDSLKELPSPEFFLVKYAVEKAMNSIHFDSAKLDCVYATINTNPDPLLANFHICRIAEEICFNGKNKLLKPFVIMDEVERMKKLFFITSDPHWDGEWISSVKDSRVDDVIQDVIMGNNNAESSSSSSITIVNGGNVSTSSTTIADDIQATAGSGGNEALAGSDGNNANVQEAGGVAAAGGGTKRKSNDAVDSAAAKRKSMDEEETVRKRTTDALKIKINVPESIMDVYEKKYPILTKMLKIYLSFTKARFDLYKRNEREAAAIKTKFDYLDYINMNHLDAENILKMFNDFPFICDLKESDKSILIKRFRQPFLLFERIYDTWNTVGSVLMDDKHIMLQSGDCYTFETLNKAEMPEKMTKVFSVIFLFWSTMLPVIRKINPDIIEAIYIFCCLLWNSSYLDIPLSKDGEEIIRRGRLVIHREMREFYGYDENQWERIFLLRHILLSTETAVNDYNKKVNDLNIPRV